MRRRKGIGAGSRTEEAARSLGVIVEAEARRVLSEAQLAADPELVAQGWERRFVTDAARMDEVVALYQDLGYDVRAEPMRHTEFNEQCNECELANLLRFRTIYTRRR